MTGATFFLDDDWKWNERAGKGEREMNKKKSNTVGHYLAFTCIFILDHRNDAPCITIVLSLGHIKSYNLKRR